MVAYWLTSKNSFLGTMSCYVSPVFASKTKASLSLVKVFFQIVQASSVRKALAGWLCGRGCAFASVCAAVGFVNL